MQMETIMQTWNFLRRGLLKWALPVWGGALDQRVCDTFLSSSKWAISCFRVVRTLARMVYALFSSINVKKQAKEGNFLQTLELYIRCILIAGKM